MADDQDKPRAPGKPRRDPAKHSQKDPARPTRAKAAREPTAPLDPALAELLNPGIQKGTAGPGAQVDPLPRVDVAGDPPVNLDGQRPA